MLKSLSGLLPQAGRAVTTQLVSSGLRAATASNTVYVRQHASQPAPSPAEFVSEKSSSRFASLQTQTAKVSLRLPGLAGHHQGAH